MNAKLVFKCVAAQVIARPVGQEFGNQKQRNALGALWRTVKSGENKMDNVGSEILFAIGDVDLGARNPVGSIAPALCLAD